MKKTLKLLVITFVVTAVLGVIASAAGETVSDVLTSSFGTMVTEMTSMIGSILPTALTLFGMSMAVAFGIKWFKKIIGKA